MKKLEKEGKPKAQKEGAVYQPTEAELAAMAFEASADTTTVVCSVFNGNWKSRRTAMGPRSTPVNVVVLNPVSEALTVYERPG